VKKSPQGIIIFEEYDKMDEKVDQYLYSFLEFGKAVNRSGKDAFFTRGLVIITSNYGVMGAGGTARKNRASGSVLPAITCDYIDRWDRHQLFSKGEEMHHEDPEVAKWSATKLRDELFDCLNRERLVNPQILSRVGKLNFVVFHHFSKNHIKQIAQQQLDKLLKTYRESHGATLQFTARLKDWVIDNAWGEGGELTFHVGARAILTEIKAHVSTPLLRFARTGKGSVRNKTWVIDVVSADEGVLQPQIKLLEKTQ
jgi:ATP-dependent Clp protease ATP-binding subunit ClpA